MSELDLNPKTQVSVTERQTEGVNYTDVYAVTVGTGLDDVLRQAQAVLDHYAGTDRTLIRRAPIAEADKDFDTGEMRYHGFVRFTVMPGVSGLRELVHEARDVVTGFGTMVAKP